MIKITALGYSKNGKNIFDNINLNIEPGSFVAVIGRNGSGKSTLARHLNALLLPQKGCVTVDEKNTSDKKNLYDVRKNTGMVFQNPESQSVATVVEDDVAFGPENIGLSEYEIRTRTNTALALCGIEHLKGRDISGLSCGEKQLVAIAGIVAMQPRYIIFDEATAMLDSDSCKAVTDCALRLKNELNIAIIWITHNPSELPLADRIIKLENGSANEIFDFSGLYEEIHHKAARKAQHRSSDSCENIITLKNISFSYDTLNGKICVFKNFSAVIEKSKITAVTGKNGSGKSTLAEILSGISTPATGTASLCDSTGLVFQTPVFFEDTVYDEIAYAPRLTGLHKNELDAHVKKTARRLQITEEQLRMSPFELSGGEQRLVSIAAIVAAEPELLILDEPVAGLDSDKKACVLKLIQDYKNDGGTVVFTTHSKSDSAFSDNVITLTAGGDEVAP